MTLASVLVVLFRDAVEVLTVVVIILVELALVAAKALASSVTFLAT